MLPIATVLVTSLAATGGWRLTLEARTLEAPQLGFASLSLSLPGCDVSPVGVVQCTLLGSAASLGPALAWRTGALPSLADARSTTVAPARGGFLHLDLLEARHFGAGPEVWWATPDAPHEHLLRQRQLTPGFGVWYSALPSRLFLGISANTWLSTLGETWFLNALSSEARVGITL